VNLGQWARRRAQPPSDSPAPTPARAKIAVRAEPALPPEEGWSACYAPHGSMYFDQHGRVRACCQNTGTYLGEVGRQTIREIWESANAEILRNALENNDYAYGCSFCEWQLRDGNSHEDGFARQFDDLEPANRRSRWPRQMEFSLTNTCNLQCVMCNGDWSSSIRRNREHREPLPAAYQDEFFEELTEFLPHLDDVKFLGGEPFLGNEPLRVLDLIAELSGPPRIAITTNATIWTPRVARIIESLDPNIQVSLDGASAGTYNAIRIGADFDAVLANIDRYVNRLGTDKVSLTHCLMIDNVHEFPAFLRLAEDRNLNVGINVVRFPERRSLYHLPADEFDAILGSLDAASAALEPSLTGNRRDAWLSQLAALRSHRSAEGSPQALRAMPFALQRNGDAPAKHPAEPWSFEVTTGVDEVVIGVRDGPSPPHPPDWLVGHTILEMRSYLKEQFGGSPVAASQPHEDELIAEFRDDAGTVCFSANVRALRARDGRLVGGQWRLLVTEGDRFATSQSGDI
jgi:MoaA/NifB/PqqE/SkfB family radical SAM enzyme